MTTNLAQLVSRLQQLTLVAAKSSNTLHTCNRWLQTSSVCHRFLDNRQRPVYKHPGNKSGRWIPRKQITEMYEYTVTPLPHPKTGGRGPNGRIWTHRIGGGHKRKFRMIAWVRGGSAEEGAPELEKITRVDYDPNRTGRIAMAVVGERKRWVMATENMKAGDIVKNSLHLSQTPVRAKEGDTYPLGSLPVGTLVSCVERYPGAGGFYARAAGTTAQLLKKVEDRCIVRLPSRREVQVSAMCQATVGRVSNIHHIKRDLGKAGRSRWLGIRPKSGRKRKKTGRFGRKIKPKKPVLVCDRPPRAENSRVYVRGRNTMYPPIQPGTFQT